MLLQLVFFITVLQLRLSTLNLSICELLLRYLVIYVILFVCMTRTPKILDIILFNMTGQMQTSSSW